MVCGGRPQVFTASCMASKISAEVHGCPKCARTTTVQPAASALRSVSPAVEKAYGKVDAPNTTTGPRGTDIFLRSIGLGRRALGIGRI